MSGQSRSEACRYDPKVARSPDPRTIAKDVSAPQPRTLRRWQSRLRGERDLEAEANRGLAKLEDTFPPPKSVVGGTSQLRHLADGIDNELIDLQYRSGTVTAPLTVALFVLIPTSVLTILPAFGGTLDATQAILLIVSLSILVVIIARYAATALGWLTGHRKQLRWLLIRRQAYLAEIRRLDAEEASLRRSEDLALVTELLRATQRRRRWL